MLSLSIVYVALAELAVAPRNARRHGKKQIRKLATAITRFGFVVPILIDRSGRIIAGHARVEAARQIGLAEVPAIYVEHLTPQQVEALALAENRVSDEASWSPETLTRRPRYGCRTCEDGVVQAPSIPRIVASGKRKVSPAW